MGAVAISMIALGVLVLVWVYRDIPPAETADKSGATAPARSVQA